MEAMSLVRSLTSFRHKNVAEDAGTQSSKSLLRGRISSPLALISTSNAMLNNAQHIAGTSKIHIAPASPTSPSSSKSGDDSDASANSSRAGQLSTDASSVDESPMENHLSCYFNPAIDTHGKVARRSASHSVLNSSAEVPSLPTRQPSHSKRAHESVHRQRSIRRMMSPPPSTSHDLHTSHDLSTDSRGSYVEVIREEPFGRELAQLDVVAEELGHAVRDAEASQDKVIMEAHGLAHFSANDYLSEIQGLLDETFGEQRLMHDTWI